MTPENYDFDEVYNQFQPKVRSYLQRMMGSEDAEDLTQDVFLKVGHGLSTFDDRSKLSTWIFKIATNTALDRRRSSGFRRTLNTLTANGIEEKDWVEIQGNKPLSADEQLIDQEMNQCIRTDIEKLPDKYRSILILSELQELSNREIAEILGITLGNAKIRLHRARKLLKKELDRHCVYYFNSKDNFACTLK